MRAVIQRVAGASVSVDGEMISSIGQGLCVLIGISRDDTREDMDYIIRKILSLRLFSSDDDDGTKWQFNVMEKGYEVLCLSQISLYHTLKGNKLDFRKAMAPELSREFYKDFLVEIRKQYRPELVKEGRFGKICLINIQNYGPLTVNLESPFSAQKAEQIKKEKVNGPKSQQQQKEDQKEQLQEQES